MHADICQRKKWKSGNGLFTKQRRHREVKENGRDLGKG